MKSFLVLAVAALVSPLFLAGGGAPEHADAPSAVASPSSAAPFAAGPHGCPDDDVTDVQNDGNYGCDAPDVCNPGQPSPPHVLHIEAGQLFGTVAPPADVVDVWTWFPFDPALGLLLQLTPAPDVPEAVRKNAPGPDYDVVALMPDCRPLPGCEGRHPGLEVEFLNCMLPPGVPYLSIVVEQKPALAAIPAVPLSALAAPDDSAPMPEPHARAASARGSAAYCDPFCTTFGYGVVVFS